MKITVSDADQVLDDIVLGDDAGGDVIIDPQPLPKESRLAQVTQLFRGERPFVTGRGNRTVQFTWTVARDHGNTGAATAFAWTHAAAVPMNAVLMIEEGAIKLGFTGVITEVTPLDQYGCATTFRYGITGRPTQIPTYD